MKEILISGSTAYDITMQYSGLFEKQRSLYNFSIIADNFQKNHGGTGVNIVYNLSLLGESSILLSSMGRDYDFPEVIKKYANLQYIHKDSHLLTAYSTIVSDSDDNRLTFFYPGAMIQANESKVGYVQEDIAVALVSANHIPTMIEHIQVLGKREKNCILFADPAQQVSQMTKNELEDFLLPAHYLIANQYEYQEILEKLSIHQNDLEKQFIAIIVTYGSEGSIIYMDGKLIKIPAISISDIQDTTGAGDAYRAGVLKALIDGYSLEIGCKLGTILASYCIQGSGSQYHYVTLSQLVEDMKTHFGVEIDIYNKRKF